MTEVSPIYHRYVEILKVIFQYFLNIHVKHFAAILRSAHDDSGTVIKPAGILKLPYAPVDVQNVQVAGFKIEDYSIIPVLFTKFPYPVESGTADVQQYVQTSSNQSALHGDIITVK